MSQIINTFICAIIMIIGVLAFGKIVLNYSIKISKFEFLIMICLLCLMHTIVGLYFTKTPKTIIMLIVNALFYKGIYKITYKKSFFLALMHMIILLPPDLIELFFVTKILHLNIEYCYNTFAGSILSNIIVCLLFILLVIILEKPLRKLISTKLEDNKKIVIYLVLIFIMFFFIFNLKS